MLGDQIDLASVRPLADDPSDKPARRQASDCQLGRARQGRVLSSASRSPVDELGPVTIDTKHLRATIERQHERTGPGRTRGQLSVDVAQRADDRELKSGCARLFDEPADPSCLRAVVSHRDAIPVKHDRLKTPSGRRRHLRSGPRRAPH